VSTKTHNTHTHTHTHTIYITPPFPAPPFSQTITVRSSEKVQDSSIERSSKLHLVDLAGSECAKSTGSSSGARMQESKNINKSLLTLGRVITSLRTQSGRIPYRDSKLTRLLQEALGGRSKTLIIATLSPSIISMEESLSTMAYAEKAHGIVNKKVEARARMAVNTGGGGGGGGDNRDDGSGSRSTFAEMEARLHFMSSQCREAQAALAKKHLEVSSIVERAEVAEASVLELTENLEAVSGVAAAQKETIGELTLTLAERNAILRARRDTEAALTSEALRLIDTLDRSVLHGDALHQSLAAADTRDRRVRKASGAVRSAVDATATALAHTAKEFHAALAAETATLVDTHLTTGVVSSNTSAETLRSTVDPLATAVASSSSLAKRAASSAADAIGAEGTASLRALHDEEAALIAATKAAAERFSKAGVAWREHVKDSEGALGQWGNASAGRLSAKIRHTETEQKAAAALFENQAELRRSEVATVRTMLQAQHDRIASLAAALGAQSKNLQAHEVAIESAAAAIAAASEDMIGGLAAQQERLAIALTSAEQVRTSLVAEHTHSIQQLGVSTEKAFAGLLSACAAQKEQLQDTVSVLEAARENGTSSITSALGNLRDNQVDAFTRAQTESFASQKACAKVATKAHSLGCKQANAVRKHLTKMTAATTTAFASHKDTTANFSKMLSTASAAHKDGAATMCVQQASHISSVRDIATTKGERSQGTLNATSAALIAAAQTHAAAQTRIHAEQRQQVEGMRAAVDEQMTVVVPDTLDAQDSILKRLIAEQATGQAAVIASTMAAVQEMLTAKMADLQASLASEVAKMREGNAALLGAAGATSDAVKSGKEAVISCVQEAETEGTKVHTATDEAAAALQETEATVEEMVAAVSKDLERMETNLAERNDADALMADSVATATGAMSNAFCAALTETERTIVKTVDNSLTLAVDKWAAACDTASENIEIIGKTNKTMNERHENCVSATRDAVDAIEDHVQVWSASITETSAALTEITLDTHNAELHASTTAAAETFCSHITTLKDETVAAAEACDATHRILVEIQKESAQQQTTMEGRKHAQSAAMSSLQAQTVTMHSTATPALVETVSALTECNADMNEVTMPNVEKADAKRASVCLKTLHTLCNGHIAVLDAEVKSTADMLAARRDATLADTTSRQASMASDAQEHVAHVENLIEAQQIRAGESVARLTDAGSQAQRVVSSAAGEIETLVGNVCGATKALTEDMSRVTAEMESACTEAARVVAENAGAFAAKVIEEVAEGITSKISTLCDEVVKVEVNPEELVAQPVFEYSKELARTPDEASIIATVGVFLAEASRVEEEEEEVKKGDGVAILVDAPTAPVVNLAAPAKKGSKSRNVLASLDKNITSAEQEGQEGAAKKSCRATGLRRPSKVAR
jgi:hypothetical protein